MSNSRIWEYLSGNRIWSLLTLGVGVFVGLLAGDIAELWWTAAHPAYVNINSVGVTTLRDGGYQLTVNMIAPKTECLRLTEHVISPDFLAPDPLLIPLASALAGTRFTTGGDQRIVLKVHPYTVSDGADWYYRYRASYICTRWPGFVSITSFTSRPLKIHFDPGLPKVLQNGLHTPSEKG